MTTARVANCIRDIRQAAMDACGFVAGMSREAFRQDTRSRYAVLMALSIIGEAATKLLALRPSLVEEYPEVPWQMMRGMRNRIIHAYFAIDEDVVWDTVQTSLPALLATLPAMEPDQGAQPGQSDKADQQE